MTGSMTMDAWGARAWPARFSRSAVFATTSVVLAVSAHRLAGGQVPSGLVILAGIVALFLIGTCLSGRERRGGQIAVLVLATQALLHVGFMASSMSTTMSGSMPGSPSAMTPAMLAKMFLCFPAGVTPTADQMATAMAGIDTSRLTSPATAGHMSDNPFTAAGLGMLCAHLVAAAVMAWWLRRGERAAWSGLQRAITVLTASSSRTLPAWTTPSVPAAVDVWVALQQVWGSGLAGRGPPAPARPISLFA